MDIEMIKENLEKLRERMRESGIDFYLVPTSDYHESEYVSEYFKVREFLSGFTGSAGTLVVGLDWAGLWADGRYYIQAEEQIKGSGITLYRSGMDKVPTIRKYLEEHMPEGGCLGFDGRVVNTRLVEVLYEKMDLKQVRISCKEDLTADIWTNRPALQFSQPWLLDTKYCGETREDKIKRIREKMEEEDAEFFLLTSLDDIAWTFNMRGDDIPCNPVFLSYALIGRLSCTLYLRRDQLSQEVSSELERSGIRLQEYEKIYEDIKTLSAVTLLLDKNKVNYSLYDSLQESVWVKNAVNPTVLMKAVKNETELNNLRAAHLKDGVAVTKCMYYLKNTIGKEELSEISISDYQEKMRRQQDGFIELSFDTISACNANAAMMHYFATPGTNAVLEKKGFLLMDSGGQYYEGTTDITRTYVLGELTAEQKKHFTLVVKSMLNLLNARFLYGCSGINLDILARGPLWNIGLDYRCGTGHGVGYLLNVHEAPNGFRWKIVPERMDSCALEAGMVTTDEPGVYIEGSHGIRIENELICKKAEENEYGQFMEFETITYVPIDLDGIDLQYLNEEDRKQLNDYHALVYDKVSPCLTEVERQWLKEYTRAV